MYFKQNANIFIFNKVIPFFLFSRAFRAGAEQFYRRFPGPRRPAPTLSSRTLGQPIRAGEGTLLTNRRPQIAV